MSVVRPQYVHETGVCVCDKIIPTYMCYIVICTETGIGITCGSQWSTHETAYVKPLS